MKNEKLSSFYKISLRKLCILLVLYVSYQAEAQLYVVKGKVTGISIEPLPFVTVNVKDQINNTVTNESGEFNITLANGHYTFIFTYLGYETYKQDVIIKNENISLNVILKENQF